ncbi:vitamin K epoxide reductase family protein [Granulicoccus phenolivorans]|uniref:vitamin K epoxide reductase family protein n=1 Tax=Granulicoccus phenolivorans TaxID=266854 RepID=UPI00041F0DDE|nr:vitamin K epoxide reductase family protein [Granulicoccus phenolivorans]
MPRSLRALRQSHRVIYITMLISALLSLTASLVLSIDAIQLAADPNAGFACDINSVISCGTVARSWQAQLLGFPNSYLGLMAEPVVITIAVAALGGVKFPRWFMLAAQAVYTIGLVFAYWLFFQSYLVINALCPWCLLVTLSTTLVWTSLMHVNIRDNNLYLPQRVHRGLKAFVEADLDLLVVLVWLVFLVTLIVVKYGPALVA